MRQAAPHAERSRARGLRGAALQPAHVRRLLALDQVLFDLAASAVLSPIIERRKANKKPEHLFLLAAGRRPVTYRALSERFARARAEAAKECPDAKTIWLRDMRKRAGQLAGSLQEASALLQHSSLSVTREHYVQGEKLKPVR